MKTLIIYQDFASAMKANATLQNLKIHADARESWEVVSLRMELLKSPPTKAEALLAATGAHLVMLVGGLSQSLPFWLADWLQRWANIRQVKDAVVVITAGADGDAPTRHAINALRQFAEQHGLGFIAAGDIVPDPRIARYPREVPRFDKNRHWGINE